MSKRKRKRPPVPSDGDLNRQAGLSAPLPAPGAPEPSETPERAISESEWLAANAWYARIEPHTRQIAAELTVRLPDGLHAEFVSKPITGTERTTWRDQPTLVYPNPADDEIAKAAWEADRFCINCPDHEACLQGAECDDVLAANSSPKEGTVPPPLPTRLLKWLDQSTKGPLGDITNALLAQGWCIHPASQRAFPSTAAADAGWPYVPLPDTLDNGRAVANLVAALRKAGPFEWRG